MYDIIAGRVNNILTVSGHDQYNDLSDNFFGNIKSNGIHEHNRYCFTYGYSP